MDVFKNSLGEFVCKKCTKAYSSIESAMDCVESHDPKPVAPEENFMEEREKKSPDLIIKDSYVETLEYSKTMEQKGELEVARKLCISLIEDYNISREQDLKTNGKVGPMTMNLGKVASENLIAFSKLIYGEKSSKLNVNVNAGKKADLEALREIMAGSNGGLKLAK